MSNSESAEAIIPTSPIIDIQSSDDIPLRDGFVTFNPGHSYQMLIDSPQIIQNKLVTQYRIKPTNIYLSVNLAELVNSKESLSDEIFMNTLFDHSVAQIANDIQAASSSWDVVNIGDSQKQRYLSARAIFLSHSKTLNGFIDTLTKGGFNLNKYQAQIDEINNHFKWKDKLPEIFSKESV